MCLLAKQGRSQFVGGEPSNHVEEDAHACAQGAAQLHLWGRAARVFARVGKLLPTHDDATQGCQSGHQQCRGILELFVTPHQSAQRVIHVYKFWNELF